MSNANAEAQRRWRQRQKEKRQADLTKAPSGLADVLATPFYKFRDAQEVPDVSFPYAMMMVGMKQPPEFRIDGTVDSDGDDKDGPLFGVNASYRAAAETVGFLISGAATLADQLNAYQKAEVKARLAEIEASDLSDPETKKAALQKVTRLNKMLDQLDKQVRWTFPQWKVTG